jgi:flagellin-specific chaperone FliS
MSTAIKLEMQKALQHVEQAAAAAQREDWPRTEQLLMEAQDRIGRLLREIELERASPKLNEPPSPAKDGPN